MNLKEKILDEVKGAEETYEKAVKIFEKFKKSEITEEELISKVGYNLIYFDNTQKEVKRGIDFFKEGNKLIEEGWALKYFSYDIMLGNTIVLKSATFGKQIPKKIKSKETIKLDYIEALLKAELKSNFVYADCSVIEEFLNDKIDEESFIKIITMQCNM